MPHPILPILLLILSAPPALASQSDRNQPLDAAADHAVSFLSQNSRTELSGNVSIHQGSLHIQADQGTIHTRSGDLSHATFSGQPVKLSKKLEDGTPMQSVSNTLEYDLSTDNATFTGDVVITKPEHILRGQRVVYNLATGQLHADGGDQRERVSMRIPPRNSKSKKSDPSP